jgi:signal transduction histidine kinase
VFTNLAVNGIEAMEHKGCLDVAIQVASGYYEIRFEDGGPGIEPDMLARVFEPFFTTKASGVGMGLAICLRLVTIHDGTIQAARLEKGGTAMIVRLPVATRQALAGETATESAGK